MLGRGTKPSLVDMNLILRNNNNFQTKKKKITLKCLRSAKNQGIIIFKKMTYEITWIVNAKTALFKKLNVQKYTEYKKSHPNSCFDSEDKKFFALLDTV